MDIQSINEILKQYPYIGEEIQENQTELNRYIELQKQARNTLKGQVMTGMPFGTGTSNPTLNAVEKIIDEYQTEIDYYSNKIKGLLDLKRKLDIAFLELTHDERRILYLKYDRGMSIRKIGYAMHKSKSAASDNIKDIQEKLVKII